MSILEHLRFQAGKIAAAYDWDSLSFRPETDLVGISAHGFTADWSIPNVRRIPAGDDIRAYIADYEQGRGQPFSKQQRRSVFASCVYWIALQRTLSAFTPTGQGRVGGGHLSAPASDRG